MFANSGDWGIDVLVGDLGGRVTVWQAKYFVRGVGRSQQSQIRSSFSSGLKAAADHRYTLGRWVVCIPASMDGPTTQWWQGWKAEQERDTGVTIDLWDETRLRELLPRPEAAVVRRHYYNPYRHDGQQSDRGTVTFPYRGLNAFEEQDAALFFGVTSLPAGSRGQTYHDMGHYDQALTDFNRAITLNPGYIWGIASRGQTYREMGRYDDALADFNQVIGLRPGHIWAIGSRGETYRLMGYHDQALDDFNQVIERHPGNAWAPGHRGQTWHALGRHDQALNDLNRAIELNPALEWAIASRIEIYPTSPRMSYRTPGPASRDTSS